MKFFKIILFLILVVNLCYAAELPLVDGIPRFRANEDRVNRYVNTLDNYSTNTSPAVAVESIRAFMIRKETELDAYSTAANGETLVEDEAGLNAANASGSVTSIVLLGSFSMTGNITLTKAFRIKAGAIITTTGHTLTINGPFLTGLYQVFSGTGTVAGSGFKETHPEWWGAKGDGTTDDTTALIAAHTALPSTGGDYILSGKYLFSSTLSFTKPIHIIGKIAGHPGSALSEVTTFIKDGSLHANGIELSGGNSLAENFALNGNTGNEGDGIAVLGNTITLRKVSVFNQYSGAGVRIGSDAGVNANGWTLDNVTSGYNKYGVVISDNTPDANAGTSINLQVLSNTDDGLVVKKAIRNTFVGTLAESNGGIGIHFCPDAPLDMSSVIVGGDSEANTGGDINFTANAQSNQTYLPQGITIVDAATNNLHLNNLTGVPTTWATAPVVIGTTSAGTGTYTTQFGGYSKSFHRIYFDINLVWTAHTGTGNTAISLPNTALLLATGITPLSVISSDISLPAGSQLVAYIDHASNKILLATSSAGVLTPLALPASGSIYISGHYYW